MRRLLVCLCAAALLGACTTNPYGNNVDTRTMGGVLVGGALGALTGRTVGLDPVSGAAANGDRRRGRLCSTSTFCAASSAVL